MNDNFLEEVRNGVRVFDLILILTVPTVLSVVFLLPESIQASLILDYRSLSAFNLWSSAFVHRGFSHFSGNLVSYCLLIVPIYLFFVLARERVLFRRIFIVFLLGLPVAISLINFATLSLKTSAGFSGIGSAFFGLLPVSMFLFIENRISEDVNSSQSVVLFLVAAANISLIYSGLSTATLGVAVAAVVLLVYDVYQIGVRDLKAIFTDLASYKGYFELVLFSGLLFLMAPKVLFPQEIAQDGAVVNILSHYLGLLFGFFIPYLYLSLRDRREIKTGLSGLLDS